MANAIKWTSATARTTGISAASLAAGANLLSSAIDNSTNKDRFLALELQFTCSTAPSAGKAVEVYVLYSLDGTNYEDGDATPTDPAKGPNEAFLARAVTTAQRQTKVDIPISPFAFKILLKSELDQAASSVTLTAYTYNEEIQ